MPSAAEEVAAAIAATGAIRFDEYMRIALYGESGFYARGGSAGRRGDFLTSPEVGPLYGAVVARALDGWWERLGRPDPFTVIDAGAGPGTLARSVLAARPACQAALHYVAVEVAAVQRAKHPDGIESRADVPPECGVGVVFANELLDNLPFRLLVFDGAWREAYVGLGREAQLVELLSAPVAPLPPWLPATAPHGARVPWQEEAAAWVERARRSVRGAVIVVDYATATTRQVAAMPWREWLRTYRGQGRGGHYLTAPGEQDITAQVVIDQLPAPDTVATQAQFLQRWGIDGLVDEGRAAWQAAAAAPNVHALRMRSRVREAEALLDSAGLGAFVVIEWSSDHVQHLSCDDRSDDPLVWGWPARSLGQSTGTTTS